MQIVYSDQELPSRVTNTIFLAGPTPRAEGMESWRRQALELLESSKFGKDGTVFVPETSDGKPQESYINQVEWEQAAIKRADCVVFWVPRRLHAAALSMPGLTTNVEFGECLHRGNLVLGFPDWADKTRYLEWQAEKHNVPVFDSLEDTLQAAIEMVGEPALREEGEVTVPNYIWSTTHFQNWYGELKQAGNKLLSFETKWVFRVGPGFVFSFCGHVQVYVTAEDRVKDNEFILSRTDIGAAVLYLPQPNVLDTEVVLVKEFRSPVRNETGYVLELPSGSSLTNTNMHEVAVAELREETGLEINASRFELYDPRQLAATWSTHKGWVISAALGDKEMNEIKAKEGQLIVGESDTERTYLTVKRVRDLFRGGEIDYATLGMIWEALA